MTNTSGIDAHSIVASFQERVDVLAGCCLSAAWWTKYHLICSDSGHTEPGAAELEDWIYMATTLCYHLFACWPLGSY